jgi:processive 1,2-diacylglycerol beta-glucosyltransferase
MLKIHVLYEHNSTKQPYGCSYIRILLPLTYPTNEKFFSVSQGTTYERADIIIVERTWKSENISLSLAEELVRKVRKDGAYLIYSIDDNLLDIKPQKILQKGLSIEQLMVVRYLANKADGIIVSTNDLQQRLYGLNNNIFVVPNALDERLLAASLPSSNSINTDTNTNKKRKVIGYMGTHTHDADLMMILQSLRSILRKYQKTWELQLIGGIADSSIIQAFAGLPIKILKVGDNGQYPDFMRWMSQSVQWDLAIAPLEDDCFTRCKSDIKFLDYSALGIPGIYSQVTPYKNTVRHLETGYLARNNSQDWQEAFEFLLNDDILRKKLAVQAQTYVFSNRILKHRAQNWQDAILSIVNKQKEFSLSKKI